MFQLGLAVVPALPYLFDKPVEEAVEWSFHEAFRAIGGEQAVSRRYVTDGQKERQDESKRTEK